MSCILILPNHPSNFVGRITFDSVADLDVEAATAIAQKKGELGLDGLSKLNYLTARALYEGQIEELELNGLTELSGDAAESLSKLDSDKLIINLWNLPASAAKILRDAGHGE
jgi:hypothetical protein